MDNRQNFKGKKFEYVEFVKGYLGNRGKFSKLNEVEKYVWINQFEKLELWKSIYTYYDIHNRKVSYAPFYFESDIEDFETNRKVVIYLVNYLRYVLEIPLSAFKFRLTNRSIWVEVVPQVIGIYPSMDLHLIYKSMMIELSSIVTKGTGISKPFDVGVYKDRQLTRVLGSYIKKSNRYVIDITYNELNYMSRKDLLNLSRYKRKLTYPSNNEFRKSETANLFFTKHKEQVRNTSLLMKNIGSVNSERLCISHLEKVGVEKGYRNTVIFYSSIYAKEQGISKEYWLSRITKFMSNFDKSDIDSLSQINATINSVYNKNYSFSCNKMKDIVGEDLCKKCNHFDICKNNNCKVYKKQLKILVEKSYGSAKNFFKDLSGEKINKRDKEKLLELYEEVNTNGSFVVIDKEVAREISSCNSEINLFLRYIYSSNNNATINPRKKLSSYAEDMGKNIRSVQRMKKKLEKDGLIKKNKIILQKNVQAVEDFNEEKFEIIDILGNDTSIQKVS